MEANVEEQMKVHVDDQMKAVGAVGESILASGDNENNRQW